MTDRPSDIQAAAAARVRRSFAELERLDMSALSRLSLSLRDVEERAPAREAAVRASRRAGLGPLLDEARVAARDYVTSSFDRAGFRVIGVDLGESRSRASVDDRVAAMAAAEDSVIAAVAAPFVSEEVREVLGTPMDRLRPVGMRSDPIARDVDQRHVVITRWSTFAVYVGLILGSLSLLALGSGVGLFGLAAAAGIGVVALVVRGRPLP